MPRSVNGLRPPVKAIDGRRLARESEDDEALENFGYACLYLEEEADKGVDCDSFEEARRILRELQKLMAWAQGSLGEVSHG
jgi:hypothetical protein